MHADGQEYGWRFWPDRYVWASFLPGIRHLYGGIVINDHIFRNGNCAQILNPFFVYNFCIQILYSVLNYIQAERKLQLNLYGGYNRV